MTDWLSYEAERLTKKYGYPVSEQDVKQIMANRAKLQKAEDKPFSDPSKAREAAQKKWELYYQQNPEKRKDK